MAAARLAGRPGEQRYRTLARAVGRPKSVLLGRVPRERHEHYDPDGNLTGFTIVEREPEWLDSDVRDLLELAQVEGESCPGCGWHPTVIADPDFIVGPVDHVCPVCAGETQYRRALTAKDDVHAKQHDKAKPAAPRPSDGRYTRMAVLTPDEIEKRGGGGGNQDRTSRP